MFIDGHKQIIDDALQAHSISIPPQMRKQLRKGIAFPDMACKKFEPTKAGDIVLSDADSCSLLKLLKTMDGQKYGFSTIYQFHRGALTLLHSMSNDTKTSLSVKRTQILDVILALLVKAAESKNPFWIGVILHTITDSYPRGHTIRDSFYEPPIVAGSELPEATTGLTKSARKEITNAISNLASDPNIPLFQTQEDAITAIKERLSQNKSSMRVSYYLRTKQKSIYHTYLIYKFLDRLMQTAKTTKSSLKISPNLGIHKRPTPTKYDLLHFQSYEIQNHTYHKWEDLLGAVKREEPLYKRILSEVATLIRLYKDFQSSKLSQDSFVKQAYTHIATQTFRISAHHVNNPTAMPSVAIQ
jgi:hypothetical protein